jgi:hypothetical protein
MGKPQRRFGKEFAAEAVRLVEVSGRTQRKIDRCGDYETRGGLNEACRKQLSGAGWFGQLNEALQAIQARGDALSEATKRG